MRRPLTARQESVAEACARLGNRVSVAAELGMTRRAVDYAVEAIRAKRAWDSAVIDAARETAGEAWDGMDDVAKFELRRTLACPLRGRR